MEFTRFCAVLKHRDEARLEPVEGTLDLSGTLTMRGISPVELHTVRYFPGFSFMTPQNRVKVNQGGKLDHHIQGTCFVYFGVSVHHFVSVFQKFGPVITPDGVHRLALPVAQPSLLGMEVA